MKFTTILSGALIAATSVTDAMPATSKTNKNNNKRQQSSSVAITGVVGNNVQQRVELRTMQRSNPDQFNLYLLGLRDMMSVPHDNPLSYYQIAGIHGRPYIPWDGWTSNAGPNGYGGGYCTHSSNVFLPWHRPYLALYEQVLYSHVQTVAGRFTGAKAARYQAAARNFRIPYWDWAALPPNCDGCAYYPKLVSNQWVDIDTPDRGVVTSLNPLFRFDFNATMTQAQLQSDMVWNPFASWIVTKRSPTTWDAAGVSQNDLVATQINNNRASLADRVYDLMTAQNNFTLVGSDSFHPGGSTGVDADSLESVHDLIHGITGSNGHMTYLDYSAFDPIFWLHHANIDRLWAMWGTIHTDNYVRGERNPGATYTYNVSTYIDADSGLVPFSSNGQRALYTSNSVRDTTKFGYTYPETANGASAATVRQFVNSLYGGSTQTKRDLIEHSKRDDGHHYHYITSIVSQRWQLNGSYIVYMFLGEPGDDPTQWSLSDKLVGMHGVSANLATADAPAMSGMDMLVSGNVPLTTTLLNKARAGEISSLDPSVIQPYLTDNLHWRVAMLDGTEVPVDNVPDLSVTVVISDVVPAASNSDFPTWGHFSSMGNVTAGKPGGHNKERWVSNSRWSVGELIDAGMRGGKLFH